MSDYAALQVRDVKADAAFSQPLTEAAADYLAEAEARLRDAILEVAAIRTALDKARARR